MYKVLYEGPAAWSLTGVARCCEAPECIYQDDVKGHADVTQNFSLTPCQTLQDQLIDLSVVLAQVTGCYALYHG